MDKLPNSLRYNASRIMQRTNTFHVRPSGPDSGSQNSTFRFSLPARSLVDISSLQFVFDLEITGLATGAAWRNAKLPSAYKLIRSCKTYVGGQIASGGLSNHHDILYAALLRATASEDYCLSHLEGGFQELISNADEVGAANAAPAATTKSMHYVCTDFLGLFRSGMENCIIDTSLFGNLEVEFTMNNASCILKQFAGTGNDNGEIGNISFNVSHAEVHVSCITQISPIYNQILELKLNEKGSKIRLPYMDYVTTVVNGSTSNRIQVQSSCIDSLLFVPLGSSYDTTNNPQDPQANANSSRYTFNTGRTLANANAAQLYATVGSEQYPRAAIKNALDVAPITTASFWGASADSRSLLYQTLSAGAQSYSRLAFLTQNFIWNQPFSNSKESYKTKILSGIDTSGQSVDIVLAQSNLIPQNGFAFLACLNTAMLEFDTNTASVSIIH